MKVIKNIFLCAVVVASLAMSPVALSSSIVRAATPKEAVCTGSGGTWDGSTCTNANANGTLESNFKTIVNILLFLIGAISVVMIIIGGIRYVVSGGDQSAVTGAKNTILYAIIGAIVAIMGYAIVNFVVSNI